MPDSVHADQATVPRPVFITGSYRSGTSILTWAIGAHPRFHPIAETGWLVPYGAGALAGYDAVSSEPQNFFKIYGVSRGEFIASVGASIDDFILKATTDEARSTSRLRWVDGTPENTKHILLLRYLFPAAKFIVLVRNPADTIASMVHFERAGGVARSVPNAARAWRSLTHRGLLAYRAFGPDVVKVVPHDDLTNDPAATLTSIFEFLNDSYAPEAGSMMQQRINSSHVTPEERDSVRRQIERRGLGERLKQSYDDALSVVGAPWSPDARALRELESLQPLPSSALASGRFSFARWALARLRERIA